MKNLMILILLLSHISAISFANSAKKELSNGSLVKVLLANGAKIQARLLRKSNDNVILDFGFDVLIIPNKQIVELASADSNGDKSTLNKKDIYSMGRQKEDTVSNLVKKYGDSVFMIKTASGLGSGFFISDKGHIITNYHVVEKERNISISIFVKQKDGYQLKEINDVEIIALQPMRDLALLKIDPKELKGLKIKPLVLAKKQELKVGNLIFAIGNPLGLERSVTQGIVSSTTRSIGQLRFIQTDASINPGNSGGPMFNIRGEVVGVVCAGMTSFNGLAFCIPTSDLINFIDNRETYLYNETQPQNGAKYLQPPFVKKQQPTKGTNK